MKVSVSKDFGNNRKPVLPLVPEPTVLIEREDLAQVDLLSDPTDPNSTKVKFAFKILKGGHGEAAREIIQWCVNVERAFTGLINNNGLLHHQMIQQFACGSAPSRFNSNALAPATPARLHLVATAQVAANRDDGANAARAQGLADHLADVQALTNKTVPAIANARTDVVTTALRQLATVLLPAKILQRAKRHLRREARKLVDVTVRECLMHVIRINTQEIPRLPPHFNNAQMLSDDKIVDILPFGTPKSWQREMDRQGLGPLASAPNDTALFMERIEMSEDFDGDKKVAAVLKKGNNKNKSNNKGKFGCRWLQTLCVARQQQCLRRFGVQDAHGAS